MPDLIQPDDRKDTARLKAVLVLVAAMAFVLSPFLAQPFTGFDPAQLPIPVDDPPIQPEGYAFAIRRHVSANLSLADWEEAEAFAVLATGFHHAFERIFVDFVLEFSGDTEEIS